MATISKMVPYIALNQGRVTFKTRLCLASTPTGKTKKTYHAIFSSRYTDYTLGKLYTAVWPASLKPTHDASLCRLCP